MKPYATTATPTAAQRNASGAARPIRCAALAPVIDMASVGAITPIESDAVARNPRLRRSRRGAVGSSAVPAAVAGQAARPLPDRGSCTGTPVTPRPRGIHRGRRAAHVPLGRRKPDRFRAPTLPGSHGHTKLDVARGCRQKVVTSHVSARRPTGADPRLLVVVAVQGLLRSSIHPVGDVVTGALVVPAQVRALGQVVA